MQDEQVIIYTNYLEKQWRVKEVPILEWKIYLNHGGAPKEKSQSILDKNVQNKI